MMEQALKPNEFWQQMFNITLTRMCELKDMLDNSTYDSAGDKWLMRKNLDDNVAWHKLSHIMIRGLQ